MRRACPGRSGRCRVSAPLARSLARRLTSAMLISLLAAACLPLADRDEYFAGTRTSAARIDAQTQSALKQAQVLQVTRRACVELESVGRAKGPGLAEQAESGVREGPCAAMNVSPKAWHGGTAIRFQNWVDDKVPELPSPGESASFVGDS